MTKDNSEADPRSLKDPNPERGQQLAMLTTAQIRKIDKMLAELGLYGEVRLIKREGKICVIQKVESEDAVQPHRTNQTPDGWPNRS
jgi:hypothetical protein